MKKIMTLLLAMSMLLASGCKGGGDNETVTDLGDGVVLAVGDKEMTADEFQFFLDDIKNQMEGTELSAEDGWESEIEGKKAIEIAKERAYESAVAYLTHIVIAEKLGLSYSKEEMKELKGQINTEYFEKYKNGDDLIELICEASLYTSQLQDKLVAEDPIDDAKKEKFFQERKEELAETYLRAKHVLILTQDEETQTPFDDAKKAEKKTIADGILKRAQSGEDFDALVSEYSEDPGSKTNPDGYVFTSGEMVPEFENCVRSLGMDEIGFTETSYGYHIIKRLDLDAKSTDNQIINGYYSEKFVEFIEKYATEFGIEPVRNDEEYNKIK